MPVLTGRAGMTSSIFTRKYTIFRELLIEKRKNALVTQQTLAILLGKHQSFVSKYESGERRLDLIEFLEVMRALQADEFEFINELEELASK